MAPLNLCAPYPWTEHVSTVVVTLASRRKRAGAQDREEHSLAFPEMSRRRLVWFAAVLGSLVRKQA